MAEPAPVEDKPAVDRDRVAAAFHRSRCVLIEVTEPTEAWKGTGFKGERDFRAAFDEASANDPLWIQQMITDSYAKPCRLPAGASQAVRP